MVTAGLPAPGPPAAMLAVELAVDELLELLDDELPHAAKPALSAVTASSVVAFPPTPLILLHRVSGIRRLLLLTDLIEKIINIIRACSFVPLTPR
jgi:hypothetical protein